MGSSTAQLLACALPRRLINCLLLACALSLSLALPGSGLVVCLSCYARWVYSTSVPDAVEILRVRTFNRKLKDLRARGTVLATLRESGASAASLPDVNASTLVNPLVPALCPPTAELQSILVCVRARSRGLGLMVAVCPITHQGVGVGGMLPRAHAHLP